ncbi:MAG: right-handed parallel beta-helix repeat-containing protein, partial [Flavobacteriales bacterium]
MTLTTPRLFTALLSLGLVVSGWCTTYYVSPSGSDTNNGTSQGTAWQTIARVNQVGSSLQAGDQVLFQSGGTYRGKLTISSSGTSAAKIVIGAYGTGAQPVISGSVAVNSWTAYSGNIWRAPVAQAVKHVFVNGTLMTLARYPNTGWLRVDQGTATSLTDAALTQASGYWNGTTAVIRSTNWSYDTARVSAFSGSTLTHSSTGNNLGSMAWGYFMRNKLSELDAAGEWFYDSAAGQLYLWCPANANPNSVLVEASVLDNGIYVNWQKQHIKIIGIALKHQYGPALYLSGSTNLEATTCTISDTYQAIRSTGSTQNLNHLTIQRTFATAVYLMDNSTSFTFNTLTDIGMVPGLGENDWGYLGVRTTGNSMVITDNVLQNIGYTGIFVQGNALVERNVVRNAVAALNDGGGIHFDTADGMIIRNNIVQNISGNLESVATNYASNVPIAHGIYFGNISIKNTLVKGNTVAGCLGNGINLDHTMVSVGNRIEDNVLFNNAIQL